MPESTLQLVADYPLRLESLGGLAPEKKTEAGNMVELLQWLLEEASGMKTGQLQHHVAVVPADCLSLGDMQTTHAAFEAPSIGGSGNRPAAAAVAAAAQAAAAAAAAAGSAAGRRSGGPFA